MSLRILLLLQGVVPVALSLSLCGWRSQSQGGNVLRYLRSSRGDPVTVVNSPDALTVVSPFLRPGNRTLQPLPGWYKFCVHWIPPLSIFNVTYGITRSLEIALTLEDEDTAEAPVPLKTCDPRDPLINVTINGQPLRNDCLITYSIPPYSRDAKFLEHEMTQVATYVDEPGPSADRRALRRWIDTALSRVQFDGDSHHFGRGAVTAAVYRLNATDLSRSVYQSLGVSLLLPAQLLEAAQRTPEKRLHVVRLRGGALFQDAANSSVLGGEVIGVSLEDTEVAHLSEDIVLTFQHQPLQAGVSALCVFWDEAVEEWSTYGCRTVPGMCRTECRCNHLTYFAVLMQVSSQVISEAHLVSLSAMTFAGCSISALSCLFTISWVCCTSRKMNPTLQIHAHLLGALFLLDVGFMVSAVLGALEDGGVCTGSAAVLHYALLAVFAWTAIEGFNLYRLVVRVFQAPVSTGKLALAGWGAPLLIVAAVLLADLENYGVYRIGVDRPSSHNATAAMCWVTGPVVHQVLNLGCFAAVLLFNALMLAAMTRRVVGLSGPGRGEKLRHCVTLLGLSCMLGLPWGLAFFSFGALYLPTQYIFSALNSLQGLFILLWYCALYQPSTGRPPHSTDSSSAAPAHPRGEQSSDDKKLLT